MEVDHTLSQVVDSITSFGNTKAASAEVIQFTRPTSSPSDALVPFTYTKARIPPMDFSRKPAQSPCTDVAISRVGLTQAPNSIAVASVSVDQDQGSLDGEQAETQATSRSAVTCKPSVPDAGATHSDTAESSRDRDAPTASAEVSATNNLDVPTFEDNVHSSIEDAQLSPATAAHRRVRQPRMMAGKVSRKYQQPIRASLPPKSLNDGELLSILLSRHKAEQQNREIQQAAQRAKDQEIDDLRGVSHTLYEQLQIVKGREHAQQMELSKLHTFKKQWESRNQTLKEHLESLNQDHQKLGQDAKDMQEQQKSVQIDKAALEVILKDVHHAFDEDRARTKKILLEARHEMELLEQTVENQDKELRANTDLLDNERDRSQRLEAAMSSITTTNEELIRMFTGHKDMIIEKLTHLQKSETQVVVAPQPENNLKPVLDQCFGILKELQNEEMVKPQDFLTLNRAVRSYANSLAKSMHHCESTSRITKDGQERLFSDVQNQLSNLRDNINVKHALGEQLMDLREVKATIRERLLATEASLVEARQHVTALENKELFHLRRISELEAEHAKLQSKESEMSQMKLQFQEANARNQMLQEQLTNVGNEALGMSKSLEQKTGEITGLTASLSKLKSQLEEAQTKTATFADQKVEYESQAAEQREKMRKQLNQVASLQLEGVESKYLNQLKQLRQEKAVVDARAEQLQMTVESSDKKRAAAEAKVEQVKLQLEELQMGISYRSRSVVRDPATTSPRDNPGTQSRGSQSGGWQDPMLWHPVRSTPRPAQPDRPDRPDPSSAKRAADGHGDCMTTSRRPRELVSQGPRTVIPDSQSQSANVKRAADAEGDCMIASKRPRKLVSQGLGPVIPDSQSQSSKGTSMVLPRNMRRLSKVAVKKTPKDKFERRFSQELDLD